MVIKLTWGTVKWEIIFRGRDCTKGEFYKGNTGTVKEVYGDGIGWKVCTKGKNTWYERMNSSRGVRLSCYL